MRKDPVEMQVYRLGREIFVRKCYKKEKRESEKTLLVADIDAAVTAASNNPAEAGTYILAKLL